MFLASLSKEQKEAFICLAHDIVVSDGEYSVGERVMMEQMRNEMGLPASFEAHYLPIDGMDDIFETRRVRTIVVLSLLRLAYADGAFEIEEQCLLTDLCKLFEISAPDFSRIQNWVRRFIALQDEAHAFMN